MWMKKGFSIQIHSTSLSSGHDIFTYPTTSQYPYDHILLFTYSHTTIKKLTNIHRIIYNVVYYRIRDIPRILADD